MKLISEGSLAVSSQTLTVSSVDDDGDISEGSDNKAMDTEGEGESNLIFI